jgi:hypothetical protein
VRKYAQVNGAGSESLRIGSKADPAEVSRSIDQLCATVLRFATTKTQTKQLKTDLQTVFQLAISLTRAFQTQQNASFTVSFPRVPAGGLEFNATIMEDRGRTNGGDGASGSSRHVGLLIFPGVFKVTTGVRTCMVKSKVVCTDEMTRYLERTPAKL